MPAISFSYKDFQDLLGKKLPVSEFGELLTLYAKGEVDGYDKKTGEVKVDFDDTNLPYLWSVEGLARLFRGVFKTHLGIPELKINRGNYRIVVDPSVKKVRPFISSFVFKGKPITGYFLKQLIQLQEKLDESYGRKRKKVSIGLYSYKRINFPIHYTTKAPDEIKFVPLEFSKALTPAEILEQHPKGREYGGILKGVNRYPILIDNKKNVLSLPPIINSNFTGKVETGDTDLLFEVTGTDEKAIYLATNIFAQALYDRGYKIYSVNIDYGSKKVRTPYIFNEKIRINRDQIKQLTGLDIKTSDVKQLLMKAGYEFKNYVVSIPPYRADILHQFDIIEDIAIMYGFDNIESAPLESYTIGSATEMNRFADKAREIAIGLGFQEILSPILSNKVVMEEKMETFGTGLVEIENIMSDTFSVIRSWLTPVMMEVLSKNKHRDFPQRVFEQGLVNIRKGNRIVGMEVLALAISHTKTDFTEIKQCLDAVMGSFGVNYSLEASDLKAFIDGRGAKIKAYGKEIGIIGEISPKVLVNWELEMPVSVLEIDLTEIKNIIF